MHYNLTHVDFYMLFKHSYPERNAVSFLEDLQNTVNSKYQNSVIDL